MKKHIISALAAVSLIAFAGCSAGVPSESQARQTAEEKLKDKSQDRVKLVSFTKVDGQQQELAGVKLYTLKYEAEIEFLKDSTWGGTYFAYQKGKESTWMNERTPVKQGERKKFKGEFTFEKSEKGWHIAE